MAQNIYPDRLFLNPTTDCFPTSASIDPAILSFHQTLPQYSQTPLVSLAGVAKELGLGGVFVKDETSRFGLPSFKILGASWAIFRVVTEALGLPSETSIEDLTQATQSASVKIFAATEGNHGRAVARMAAVIGAQAFIFVPKHVDRHIIDLITGEGANIEIIDGDYDQAVRAAAGRSKEKNGLLIQDTAWDGYERIPQWIVDGYDTMLQEIDEQAPAIIQEPIDFIFVPVGVGSFAQAVVAHYKSLGHTPGIIAVEPDSAACLKSSLQAGKVTTISTGDSVMAGMNCATMTTIAFPVLKAGLEAVTTVSDFEAHLAVRELEIYGVRAGPCGAATLAALRSLTTQARTNLGLGARSNIVLFCSEGSREYNTPLDVSVDDPVALTQALVRINSSNPGLSSTGAGEKEITEFVAAWLAHHGFEVHRLEKHPGRLSVVGVGRGSGGGRSLMFNGHVDTVTLDSYEGDPLSGHIRDGSVFGRGSFDMKAGLAASMVAAVRARTSGIRGDILVAAVADEEDGSAGTIELLDAGWRADGAVISEPSHLEVTLSHRGFVWFDVDIVGKAAHGSRPELGVDAIVYAGYFLVELDKYAQELAIGPRHPLLGAGTVHASLITGGEERSSYPALCTISIERRTVAGETELVVQEQLRTILDTLAAQLPDFTYRLRTGLCRNPFEADRENVLTKIMLSEAEKTLGHPPVIRAEPFWTDAALLAEKGIPALLFGVDGGGAHAATEWATIDSIEKVTATLVRVAQDFCRQS